MKRYQHKKTKQIIGEETYRAMSRKEQKEWVLYDIISDGETKQDTHQDNNDNVLGAIVLGSLLSDSSPPSDTQSDLGSSNDSSSSTDLGGGDSGGGGASGDW